MCACVPADGREEEEQQQQQLPTDKLACHRHVPPPRTPAVLVSCGSFNPPTVMHMRMFELATAALAQRGVDVWGCYMSPVADAYGKAGLAPVTHRLEMCRRAADSSAAVMVGGWEAAQPGYTRTLQVGGVGRWWWRHARAVSCSGALC
jgi:nicotinamide mononucleotide adenylyltransferase